MDSIAIRWAGSRPAIRGSRKALTAFTLWLLATSTPAWAVTLREAAEKAGLYIGAAVTGSAVSGSNADYQRVVREQFNAVVCENDMKFQNTEPRRGQFSYSAADRVVAFAQANGMKVRGHTLVWHSQSGWAANLNAGRAEMLQVMKTHIEAVAGHYRGKILEWDVVNEAVADGSVSLRSSFWRQRIGEDFIDSAFVYAHRADPTALLFYNDYGAEFMNTKSNGVYALVKRLKENGIPIHGVGLQCHFSGSSINKAQIDENIKRLGALGLRVAITELEIVDPSHSTRPWTDLMDVCLANANCTTFMTWGVYDAMSWKSSGGTCNCLIYDTRLQPKAIHGALLASLAKADPAVAAARKAYGSVTSRIAPIAPRRDVQVRGWLRGPWAGSPALSLGGGARSDVLGRLADEKPALR